MRGSFGAAGKGFESLTPSPPCRKPPIKGKKESFQKKKKNSKKRKKNPADPKRGAC